VWKSSLLYLWDNRNSERRKNQRFHIANLIGKKKKNRDNKWRTLDRLKCVVQHMLHGFNSLMRVHGNPSVQRSAAIIIWQQELTRTHYWHKTLSTLFFFLFFSPCYPVFGMSHNRTSPKTNNRMSTYSQFQNWDISGCRIYCNLLLQRWARLVQMWRDDQPLQRLESNCELCKWRTQVWIAGE
jgi:hypothetical protein